MRNDIALYTSQYQASQAILESHALPIGITAYPPRWRLAYQMVPLKELAPSKAILAKVKADGDHAAFEAAYERQLDELGVDKIAAMLEELADAYDAKALVLLCFENVAKLGEHSCHRRQFARWWEEKTGQAIRELPGSAGVKAKKPAAPKPPKPVAAQATLF